MTHLTHSAIGILISLTSIALALALMSIAQGLTAIWGGN